MAQFFRARPPEPEEQPRPVPRRRALSGRWSQGSARSRGHEKSAGPPNSGCAARSGRHDTPRSALLDPTSAKRGKLCQPVKPLWRIGDQGKDAELGTDGHILALSSLFNQGRHAGTGSHFRRQQATFWTRGGSKSDCSLGLLRCLQRLQGLRHQRFECTQPLFIAP